jgi:hypothetical protein
VEILSEPLQLKLHHLPGQLGFARPCICQDNTVDPVFVFMKIVIREFILDIEHNEKKQATFIYSYFRLSAGFAKADYIVCDETVKKAINRVKTAVRMNTPAPSATG